MIEMIMLLVLWVLVGYSVSRLFLDRLGLSLGYDIGISLALGMGVNTIFFLLFSLGEIRVTAALIWSGTLVVLALLQIARMYFKVGLEKEKESLRKLIAMRYSLTDFALLTAIGVFLFQLYYKALRMGFQRPDEWSFWGVATKRIFQTGSVFLKDIVYIGFDRYPLHLPINAASLNIVAGSFVENYSRLIGPTTMVFLTVMVGVFLQETKLKRTEILLFLILLLTAGHELTIISALLYADTPYAYFYTAAIILFSTVILRPNMERKRIYLAAGLLLALSSWTKMEGAIIGFASACTLYIFDYIYSRKTRKFELAEPAILIGVTVSLPVMWSIIGTFQNYAKAGWTAKMFSNMDNLFENTWVVARQMYVKTVRRDNYSLFWGWVVLAAGALVVWFRENKLGLLLFTLIVLNVGYLFASYLFVFGPAEGLTAASFERYIIHVLPCGVMLVAVIYANLKGRFIRKDLYEK